MKARIAAFLTLVMPFGLSADPSGLGGDSFYLVGKANGGGGGSSEGGGFTLRGTIGEATAGLLIGGDYRLQGGFIGVLISDTIGGDAVLTVTMQANGQAALSWDVSGYALEFRNALGAEDWEPVDLPATERRYVTDANLPTRFFRLRLR